jgi:hypothetical protein
MGKMPMLQEIGAPRGAPIYLLLSYFIRPFYAEAVR